MATTVTRKTADFSDLDFNLTRLSTTSDVAKKTDVEAVKQSMKSLIQTNYFDRPFHPEPIVQLQTCCLKTIHL